MIYQILKHFHSELRWIILLLFCISIITSFVKLFRNSGYGSFDSGVFRYLLTGVHTQVLSGLILYFISPKVIFSAAGFENPVTRFYLIEHIGAMIIAVTILTIGYVKVKNSTNDRFRFKNSLWFQLISLMIILVMIPWPWRSLGGGWI